MPRKSDSLPINNPKLDKRVKLTDQQREMIKEEYETGLISQRKLAIKYGVSRRLISFILDPEKAEKVKQQFLERRKDGRYYDREKHNKHVKEHRDYKKDLYNKGLLDDN